MCYNHSLLLGPRPEQRIRLEYRTFCLRRKNPLFQSQTVFPFLHTILECNIIYRSTREYASTQNVSKHLNIQLQYDVFSRVAFQVSTFLKVYKIEPLQMPGSIVTRFSPTTQQGKLPEIITDMCRVRIRFPTDFKRLLVYVKYSA